MNERTDPTVVTTNRTTRRPKARQPAQPVSVSHTVIRRKPTIADAAPTARPARSAPRARWGRRTALDSVASLRIDPRDGRRERPVRQCREHPLGGRTRARALRAQDEREPSRDEPDHRSCQQRPTGLQLAASASAPTTRRWRLETESMRSSSVRRSTWAACGSTPARGRWARVSRPDSLGDRCTRTRRLGRSCDSRSCGCP